MMIDLPTAAPSSGISKYIPKDCPRCSGLHTSPSTPPARAYILLAPNPAKNLAAIKTSFVLANPHTMFQTRNQTLLAWRIFWRPYTSLNGPMNRGPKAVASRYIESAITASVEFMSSSCAIVVRAGAMMVETMMRLNAVAERTSVTSHFLREGQSLGLSASKDVSKVTKKGSSVLSFGDIAAGVGTIAISIPPASAAMVVSLGSVPVYREAILRDLVKNDNE